MVDTAAYTGIYGASEEFQRAREAFKEDPTNAELLVAAVDAASSAEVTLLTFRGLENVRTFGEPIAGYASANVVLDYPDGRSLMLTTAKDKACTGEEFAEDPSLLMPRNLSSTAGLPPIVASKARFSSTSAFDVHGK